MEVEYLVPSVENTETTSRNSAEGIPKQCCRKGDVIYYAKPENINMTRKNDSTGKTDTSSVARPSLESDGHTDTINSGESLFKVFTFEQSSNDEDTEKCIAFWRSVMEKNLTPIKCTIIENTKNPTPQVNQKQISVDKEPSKASSEDVAERIHEEYRNMWLTAVREIQKKKLHEIKLTAKARCKMCDSISSSVDEDGDKIDKRAIKKEIKELNNWVSKSTKKQKRISKEANSRTKTSSSDSLIDGTHPNKGQHSKTLTNTRLTSGDSMNKESGASTCVLDKTKTESATTSLIEKNKKNLVPDTKTYIHQDVIGEKKKNGVYSKWRNNALEEVCQCRNSRCSCNINPAVVAISEKESDSTTADARQKCAAEKKNQANVRNTQQCLPEKLNQGVKGLLLEMEIKDGKDQAKSQNHLDKISDCNAEQKEIQADVNESPQATDGDADQSKQQNLNSPMDERFSDQKFISALRDEIQSTSALLERGNMGKMPKMRQRNLSLFLQCICSNPSCDCGSYKEYLSRKYDTGSDLNLPRPSSTPSMIKRNSLEIYRKSFSKRKLLSEKENSVASMNIRVPDNTVTSFGNSYTRESSMRKLVDNEPKTSKLGRTISLMLKACRCSNEVCDCFQIEKIKRNHIDTDNHALTTPSRTAIKRVDSLELARRRLSLFDSSTKSSVQILYPPSTFDDNISILNEHLT